MTAETLVKLGFHGGRYEGELAARTPPGIEAVHDGRIVAEAALSLMTEGRYRISVTLPVEVLSDGVQVVSLRSKRTGEILDRITIIAGEAAQDDLLAEIALLRDEFEMLKRAFRSHVSAEMPVPPDRS